MSDGWVRVEDGLPEEYRNVWIWSADCDVAYGWFAQVCGFRIGAVDAGKVTHWRYAEVPEPPEEAT